MNEVEASHRTLDHGPGRLRSAIGILDRLVGDALIRASFLRGSGVVLLYHRVSTECDPVYPPLDPEVFEAHLDLVTRYFDVLPLTEWLDRIGAGRSLGRCCTITFDDGYRDFLDHALPRLRRRALPCCHFLVTRCLSSGLEPWTLRARRLGLEDEVQYLASQPEDSREQILQEAVARRGDIAGAAMMGEGDIRSLLNADVEIGSHTASHCWLTDIAPRERARELSESRARLTELCGRSVEVLSYPQGLQNAQVRAAARASGYRAAFAVGQLPTLPNADRMAIPRMDLTDRPVGMVRLELSGALPLARRLRRGR